MSNASTVRMLFKLMRIIVVLTVTQTLLLLFFYFTELGKEMGTCICAIVQGTKWHKIKFKMSSLDRDNNDSPISVFMPE